MKQLCKDSYERATLQGLWAPGEDASRLPGNIIEAATVQVIDKRSPSYDSYFESPLNVLVECTRSFFFFSVLHMYIKL